MIRGTGKAESFGWGWGSSSRRTMTGGARGGVRWETVMGGEHGNNVAEMATGGARRGEEPSYLCGGWSDDNSNTMLMSAPSDKPNMAAWWADPIYVFPGSSWPLRLRIFLTHASVNMPRDPANTGSVRLCWEKSCGGSSRLTVPKKNIPTMLLFSENCIPSNP
jgi:hypothetical protein